MHNTIGFLENVLCQEDVKKFIAENIGQAKIHGNFTDGQSLKDYGIDFFDSVKNEPRQMWISCYNPACPLSKNDKPLTELSIPYGGRSVEIIESIIRNFGGGWVHDSSDSDMWRRVE